MSRKTSILSLGYFLFILFNYISGIVTGVASLILYFLSLLAPFVLAFFDTRDDSEKSGRYFTLDTTGAKTTLTMLFPSVFAVLLVSMITNMIIRETVGITNNADLGSSLGFALIYHAVFPSVIEEMLFRYLPLKILSGQSRRGAVILSSIFFAMVHRSVFSIPYAFVAGMIFMTVDIVTDSVLPSMIIHFINNSLAVLMIFFGDNNVFAFSFYALLILGTLISVALIIKNKTEFKEKVSYAFTAGERVKASPSLFICIGASLLVTILGLF